VAESLGCLGIRVERRADRPALVEVVTDIDALPITLWG